MTTTHRPALGQIITVPRRAIRALRRVNKELLHASEAIIRSGRGAQPAGEDARGRAS